MKIRKMTLLWLALAGFVFGMVLAVMGLFVGLQVSPVAANIMLFPATALAGLFDTPFGYMPPALRLALFASCGVFWGCIFAGAHIWMRRRRR